MRPSSSAHEVRLLRRNPFGTSLRGRPAAFRLILWNNRTTLFEAGSASAEFTARMLVAVDRMMMDMVAAIAWNDYDQRRERQAQRIVKDKTRGAFKGRPVDREKHERVRQPLEKGFSIKKTAELAGAAPSPVHGFKRAVPD